MQEVKRSKENMEKLFDKEEILNNIDLPDKLDKLIQDSVNIGYARTQAHKRFQRRLYMKRAAAIIGILLVGGIAAIPVRAYVLSVVQSRMEQVPKEEVATILEAVDEAEVEADTYSRDYTDKEREKLKDLNKAYQQGTFPEGELRQETTRNSSITDAVYFAQDTSTFYLPERELTDEELLELIDFQTKRDYALMERYEATEGAERKEEQRKSKEKVLEEGGITEEEAIVMGKEWLQKLYGVSYEGMELNHYLDDESFLSEKPVYNVNFSIRSQEYYYFWMDAQSGELISAEASFADDLDKEPISKADIEQRTARLCGKAEEALTQFLGKAPDYEQTVMNYMSKDGNVARHVSIYYYFVRQDGSAYGIGVDAESGEFRSYCLKQNFEEYRKEMEETQNAVGKGEREWIFKDITVAGDFDS